MPRPAFTASFAFAIVFVTSLAAVADWPQWRGPGRDGLSPEKGLLPSWPTDGPHKVWQTTGLGEAYSSVSVANGRVFTQGNVEDEARIHCLDERTGKLLWSVSLAGEEQAFTDRRGNGARGTPTVDGDVVFVESGSGALNCLKVADGSVVWSLNLSKDLGGKEPGWGYSESPLVDGEKLIVTPGGNNGAVAALNKRTGEVIWQSTDVTDRAHYSSPIVAEIDGVRQYIQFTSKRVIGLDAETGKLLWDYERSANGTANVATPIHRDNYVFSASGYGTGGGLVKVTLSGSTWAAEEVYFEKKMANHHGGIVLVDDTLYGFNSGGLLAMDFMTGEITMQDRSVSKGSLCYADGHLYCLGEKNAMALVKADPTNYTETGRFEIPSSTWPTWAHPVVANGRLYLRDQDTLTCYDVLSAAE